MQDIVSRECGHMPLIGSNAGAGLTGGRGVVAGRVDCLLVIG
jgi:hypothetical protein